MTDSDKVALIDKIIADFWEFNNDEQISASAAAIVAAISTITGFEGAKDG